MPVFAQTPPGEPGIGGEEVTKEVRIVWHKTNQAWKACRKFYPNERKCMEATGVFVVLDGVCHVYAPDPVFNPALAGGGSHASYWWILGHEVKHCFDGFFHL